jgi:CDP-glucose 4,6-dehydratase
MDFLKLFKGKKVLITGHSGFKGGWLALWLHKLGANVTGYALDPQFENGIFCASGISSLIHDFRGDIRDLKKLTELFHQVQPEFVFHLAAQPIVLQSYKNPVETFEVNVQGTVNVLEAIRFTPSVKAAVMVTTDKCYENKEWPWGYRETDPMGGHDPYSASKGAAELVINAYRRSFFSGNRLIGLASARAGNVIGGGDWSENRLIPDIIRAIQHDSIVEIRNPYSTRPWQFVLDPLAGYLKLAAALYEEPKKYTEAWNFGPYANEVQTVKKVVETLISYAGCGSWADISTGDNPHEANILQLDISKAIQKLNWRPAMNFNESVSMTVDWYFNANKGSVLKFSLGQISKFEDKCRLLNES